METVVAALVAAVTSVLVTILSLQLTGRQKRLEKERTRQQEINVRYLNPLRRQATEVHIRLTEILSAIESDGERKHVLGLIADPSDLVAKSAGWFAGEGCYLTSTAYLTACLFARVEQVGDNYPYLRLAESDDTTLSGLIVNVQLAFLRDLGIYYVLQPSIGHDLLTEDGARLLTYREFCGMLGDPEHLAWLSPLFRIYLEAARAEKLDRLRHAESSTLELVAFLDHCVGGGHAIASRQTVEGATSDRQAQ